MTTNGVLLAAHVGALKDAGLHRLTVSLDTLDAARFKALTRSDELDRVLAGIAAAAPLFPGTEDRHGGDPRRQRRRARGAHRVRRHTRRRGALHRVHGRGRRHALVDGPRGLAARDARTARRPLRRDRADRASRRRRRPIASGCRTARCSASSRPPPSRSATPAIAAASRPTACGTCACTPRAAPTCARSCAAGRRDEEIAELVRATWSAPRRPRRRGAPRERRSLAADSARSAADGSPPRDAHEGGITEASGSRLRASAWHGFARRVRLSAV